MDDTLDAGPVRPWLDALRTALRDGVATDVPCGDCTTCCTSSQFIHLTPDDAEALARIPKKLRFPAPRLPPGHAVLGYDTKGRCPMFTASGCGIYAHRPRTCRVYDCRVFAAADVVPDRAPIARQVRRWRFATPTEADEALLAAIRAAAVFLRDRPDALPDGVGPLDAAQRAVLATEVCALFTDGAPPAERVREAVAAAVRR